MIENDHRDLLQPSEPDDLASPEQVADLLAGAGMVHGCLHWSSVTIREGVDAHGRLFRVTQDADSGRGLIENPASAIRTGSTQSAANDPWR